MSKPWLCVRHRENLGCVGHAIAQRSPHNEDLDRQVFIVDGVRVRDDQDVREDEELNRGMAWMGKISPYEGAVREKRSENNGHGCLCPLPCQPAI